MKYILNAPILTNYGTFNFRKVSVEEAKEFVNVNGDIISAVGHQGTAEILSEILEKKVECNRIQVSMEPGDQALVFRLLTRLPEGIVLSKEELESLKFELGVLERLE